jgi:hypothetical protein
VTLSHNGKTVDILDRVRGDGDTQEGDGSKLSGNYTFVPSGGTNFNTIAGAIGSSGTMPTGYSYATVPVGNTNPLGGVSAADGSLSDFGGMPLSGAWTLNISDRVASFTGTVSGWQFVAIRSPVVDSDITIADASYNRFPTLTVGSTTSTDVTLVEGGIVQNVQAFNASRLFMIAGTATSLRAEDTSRLFVNAGTVSGDIAVTENGRLTMGGGSAASVTVSDNGIANITDGTVGRVNASGDGKAYVFDGSFIDLATSGNGAIFVYGGSISRNTMYAYDNGSYSLFGDDLLLDFASATRGDDGNGFLGTFYNLTGTLTDGTALNTRFFDADGGFSVGSGDASTSALFFNGAAVSAVTVPEANSFALALPALGMVGAVLVRRRKK